ncbi:phosphoenolpyruvate-protein phosphotransferase [Achromatium sp. WMS2]|nr:phosphoenolpyruvate-protein phosphotransferase [Achromatium sp. WMS2]
MLEFLQRIVQEVNEATDLERALDIIVHRVKQFIAADVCSVYLNDFEHMEHVLMATDGLRPEAIGKVRVPMKRGLIGLISERAEPLNLEEVVDHPQYLPSHETGEIGYHGFSGVPIIQYRQVLGVLVVRRREPRRFTDQDVTCLITLAAQLAGAITHARASGELALLQGKRNLSNRFFEGRAASGGIAIGNILVVYPPADLASVPDHPALDPESEEANFRNSLAQASADLETLAERMAGWLSSEELALFDAWRLMLQGGSLIEKTVRRIYEGNWAQGALRETVHEHAQIFESMEDPYLRERAKDIKDLGTRILMHLQDNAQAPLTYHNQTILAGEDLSPLQLAEVPRDKLIGVVSTTGSKSSHIAILASGMGVPAVMGVTNLPLGRMDGLEAILDGHRGRIYVMPAPSVLSEYQRLADADRALETTLGVLRGHPSSTIDGHALPLYLNTGLISETRPMGIEEASGVGLYRTELPFMIRDRFPSEEIQAAEYRQVLTAFYPRPVTLRTLDIGGDKYLPYFPIRESNPFLGWRGIRISLDQPELFLTQIRAIMRAALELNNARILLPMISVLEEVDEAKRHIDRAYKELIEEGHAVTMPPLGAMVEVPAIAYQIKALARKVDFLSIGTNDLTQYLLAVDRNNRVVAGLYDDLHPTVLRALNQIVTGAIAESVEVSVCGEMAGNPMATVLLMGMGVNSLSMSAGSLLPVKAVVRAFTLTQAKALLETALILDSAAQVRSLLKDALRDEGLGLLVRDANKNTDNNRSL